jgi:hypothetical protein
MLRAAFDANGERPVSENELAMVSKWWIWQTHAADCAGGASIENLQRNESGGFFAKFWAN